jgi:hypothetical protein
MDLRDRTDWGDFASFENESRRGPTRAKRAAYERRALSDIHSDSPVSRTLDRLGVPPWLVTALVIAVWISVPVVTAAWFYHHEWVNHHRAWSYDDYQRGFASGSGLPVGMGASAACDAATSRAYPSDIRRAADRQPRSRVGTEVSMFHGGCLDGAAGKPADPARGIDRFVEND